MPWGFGRPRGRPPETGSVVTLREDLHSTPCDAPQRCRDRSFLNHCPPRIAEIFHYWDRLRGDRRMPRRSDFDPARVVHHLPNILLVDVEGSDSRGWPILRYRVVGTEECLLRGQDPTGRLVSEAYFGPSLETVMSTYDVVYREGSFLYELIEFMTDNGLWHSEFGLLMPFSEDGSSVSQILVYSQSSDFEVEH